MKIIREIMCVCLAGYVQRRGSELKLNKQPEHHHRPQPAAYKLSILDAAAAAVQYTTSLSTIKHIMVEKQYYYIK